MLKLVCIFNLLVRLVFQLMLGNQYEYLFDLLLKVLVLLVSLILFCVYQFVFVQVVICEDELILVFLQCRLMDMFMGMDVLKEWFYWLQVEVDFLVVCQLLVLGWLQFVGVVKYVLVVVCDSGMLFVLDVLYFIVLVMVCLCRVVKFGMKNVENRCGLLWFGIWLKRLFRLYCDIGMFLNLF